MGNSGSFEENLKKKTLSINEQHVQVDDAISRINLEANRIISLILDRNYTDREAICKKIGYQKVDELSKFFPIETLEGVRYQMGIIPDSNDPNMAALQSNKQSVCLSIVNFYLKKINLITNIQNELPNCKNMERAVYDNLSAKLQAQGINNEEWLAVYNKMEKFNKEIISRQQLIERELERIRKATTMRELDGIANTVNGILSKTNSICRNYENDLVLFSDKSLPKAVVSPPISASMFPQPMSPQRVVNVPMSPQRVVNVPMSPQRMQQPIIHNVVQEVPVVQRTILTPKVVEHQVVQQQIPVMTGQTPIQVPLQSSVSVMNVKPATQKIPVAPFPEKKTVISTSMMKIPVKRDIQMSKPLTTTTTTKTKVERVMTPKLKKSQNRPVRVAHDFNPSGKGEISVKKDELVTYMGSTNNGWSRVLATDGREGYVPHSYLSHM